MKKLFLKLVVFSSIITLTGCGFLKDPFEGSSSNESINNNESISVKSKKVIDLNEGKYHVGDNFAEKCDIVLRTTYSNNKTDDKTIAYTINQIKNTTTNNVLPNNAAFTEAGSYKVTIGYRIDGSSKTTSFNITIKTGIEESGFTVNSIEFKEVFYTFGKKILEANSNLMFDIYWNAPDSSEPVYELAYYKNISSYMNLKLFKNGGSANVIDQAIEKGQSYELVASFKKFSSIAAKYEFTVSDKPGYYQLTNATIYSDTYTDSSIHTGVAKMMVITIDLEPGSSDYSKIEWTQSMLNKVNTMFFSESKTAANGWYSMKTYYDDVSKGMISIEGQVFAPYKAEYTMKEVSEDLSYHKLHNVFKAAIENVKASNSSINWAEYDLNRDGYLDNLHFVTNCAATKGISWSSPLWPHQYSIMGKSANVNYPQGNRYETTILGMLEDAITIIHEQGHMFGVPDYYNYTQGDEEDINYIGSFDMQSHNVGDWNPWSKFLVGWGKPIVVDGTNDVTTITFQSAALTNQFVVIPANIETYNNSAFDEFFILELFTDDGVNSAFWKHISTQPTQKAGVRLYHVDGRLWDSNTYQLLDDVDDVVASKNAGHYIDFACSNSSSFGDYPGVNYYGYHDYKLISVIQKGGEDTFSRSGSAYRKVLNYSDLFVSGDKFDFENYDHFLSKTNVETETMNNGEVFPYSIYFNEVSREGCTVTITKK